MSVKRLQILSILFIISLISCNKYEKKIITIPEEESFITENIEDIQPEEKLILYEDETIYTIFVHPLIISPELAFDKDSHQSYMYDWFVTSNEFSRGLQELYDNNYILIKSTDIYEVDENQNIIYKDLYLPENKKPLIFSIDDLNYYKTMKNNGCAQYLYLDENGNLADKKLDSDEPDYGESIFILENFIQEHPDFSFHNARGIIALTGYNGILGYATHKLNNDDYEQIKSNTIDVVNKLKETGWEFASHTYSHIHPLKCSDKEITNDCTQWDNEVKPLIGNTSIFIYPYGEEPKKSGQKVLSDFGFKFFLAVGKGIQTQRNDDFLLVYRRAFDGVLLKYHSKNVFLDIDKVYNDPRD